MYLKSLVLKGFKSFADRSVISLEPGIAAVVGPNGSGKSNISDAVLWVLGERNAKNLRGQAMEDVIFAGSSARKSVGIAEVDLVLDNTDGTLPVDYTEVVLTRRMYRSGESEYLINGSVVRRMDVLDILHDSGLGTGTHSIISQGNLDSILQSKPEDRRSLIEEAAGILKHKQRKRKSERKLEQMDVHLTRVRDISQEVERQLKPLERKAKRAQAYQELSKELAELNLVLAVDDLRALQKKWDKILDQEKHYNDLLGEARGRISETEKKVEELQQEIQMRSENAGEIAKRYRQAQSITERLDGTALLLREKKRASLNYEAEYSTSLETNKIKLDQAEKTRQETITQLDEVKAEKQSIDLKVESIASQQQTLASRQLAIQEQIYICVKEEADLAEQLETSRLQQMEAKELLSNNLAQEKLISHRGTELEGQLEEGRSEYDKLKNKSRELQEKLEKLALDETQAREKVSVLHVAAEQARKEYEEAREKQALISSEVKALREMERAKMSDNPTFSWMLDNASNFTGVIRPLAQVVQAPAELEPVVEKLLEKDITAFLIEDDATVKQIVEELTQQNDNGEVVLFTHENSQRITHESTFAGSKAQSLLSLLSYPDECAQVIEFLFAQTYLCDNEEEALDYCQGCTSKARFVTKNGHVFSSDGRISLGNNVSSEESVLARTRRIDELEKALSTAQKRCEETLRSREKSEEDLREIQGRSLKLSQELAQLQGQTESVKEQEKRSSEKVQALQREFEVLQKQREEMQNVVADTRPKTQELEQRINELTEKLKAKQSFLAEQRESLKPLQVDAKSAEDQLAEVRLKAATLAERVTYLERVLVGRDQELKSLHEESRQIRENAYKKSVAGQRVLPLIETIQLLIDSARKHLAKLEKATLDEESSSAGFHACLQEGRQLARAAQDGFDAVNTKLSETRVDKGRLEIQVEAAINTIVHDCKTPLETALEYPVPENRREVEDSTFKLRRRIANMGTINPDAAVEYEELKVRYDYMSSQLEDLNIARKALAKIVRVIDQRMKDDFVTTFEKVNENFKEIFSILFPGGSAHLSLVDEEDPENSGVEVSAQPRGKRISKMMLMSGGEKSLTALALLFAVYRIRTTPFYILDEVEAALDDSNLRRLCAYLDSLRNDTQLIMITHQRRTMEMADMLYGISMQADGVTKVVSQKLDRALQYAEG